MIFKDISLGDKKTINSYLRQSDYQSCEYCFSNLYIWRKSYSTQYAVTDGCIVFKMNYDGKTAYSIPAGAGDKKTVISKIADIMLPGDRLVWLTDNNVEMVKDEFSDVFEICFNENNSEYIYLSSDLISLHGRKFHTKRNHIHSFINDNPDFKYAPLTDDNLTDCYNLYLKWREEKDGLYEEDPTALEECIKHFKDLDLIGGYLFSDKGMCAFTMGTRLNSNTFVTHVEKGLDACDGAYAVINNLFAKQIGEGYMFINREDDLGIPGLRQSKLSYHPVYILKKYDAVKK